MSRFEASWIELVNADSTCLGREDFVRYLSRKNGTERLELSPDEVDALHKMVEMIRRAFGDLQSQGPMELAQLRELVARYSFSYDMEAGVFRPVPSSPAEEIGDYWRAKLVILPAVLSFVLWEGSRRVKSNAEVRRCEGMHRIKPGHPKFRLSHEFREDDGDVGSPSRTDGEIVTLMGQTGNGSILYQRCRRLFVPRREGRFCTKQCMDNTYVFHRLQKRSGESLQPAGTRS